MKKKKTPTKPSFAAVMCGEHRKKSKKTPLSCVSSEGGGSGAAGARMEEMTLRLMFRVREGGSKV